MRLRGGSRSMTYSAVAGEIIGLGSPPLSTAQAFSTTGWRPLGFSHGLTGEGDDDVLGYTDTARGLVVRLRISRSATRFATDTWDGRQWRELAGAGLPSVHEPSVAYDAARGEAVLFGGVPATGITSNETWLFNGQRWRRATPATLPRDRHGASLAYDAARQRVVLFGGSSIGLGRQTLLNDTWEWDGTNWQAMSPPVSPRARFRASAAYDPKARAIIMVGGLDTFPSVGHSDTWQWDGRTWTSWPGQDPRERPRGLNSLVHDPHRRALVLSSGSTAGGRVMTWIARGTRWIQVAECHGKLAWDPVANRVLDMRNVRYLIDPGHATDLGGACAASPREITLRPRCDLTVVNPALGLDLQGLRGVVPCALLLGVREAYVRFGACALRIDPADAVWLPGRSNGHGFATFALPGPQLAGREFLAQAVAIDLQAPGGMESSNALRIAIGR